MMRVLLSLGLAAVCMLQTSAARAHGRFPAAVSVAMADDGALAVGTTFGLLTRAPDRNAWSFICQAALGVEEGTELSVSFEGSVLHVSSLDMHASSSDLGCSLSRVPGPAPLPTRPRVANAEVFASQLLAQLADEPNVSFVRARTRTGDRLLRSDDAGASFRMLQQMTGALLSFAMPESSSQLYWGGERDGLWYSPDLGDTLVSLDPAPEVTCLRAHGGAVLMCDQRPTAPFQVGVSRDGGGSFEPLLQFAELTGTAPCEAPSYAAQCQTQWLHELPSLLVFRAAHAPEEPSTSPPADEQPAPPLEPAAPGAQSVEQSANCSTSTAPSAAPCCWLLLAACSVLLRRLRRPD